MEGDELDPKFTTHAAQFLLEYYKDAQGRLNEQHAEMAKWLVASLLAVNTGGLAALVASSDKVPVSLTAGTLFLAGIIFALAVGAAIQRSNVRALKPIGEAIGGVLPYAAGQEMDITADEAQAFFEKKEAEARVGAWLAPGLGYISAACFAIGALISGVIWASSVAASDAARRANDNRCIALESDMLREAPRRTDAPELFRTLGCKPQTNLPVHQRR